MPTVMTAMTFDVCVLGSANLDLVATVVRLPGPGETVSSSGYHEYPGGKGLNQGYFGEVQSFPKYPWLRSLMQTKKGFCAMKNH